MEINPESLLKTNGLSRRQALRNLGLGAVGMTALGAFTKTTFAQAENMDVAIFNFALNLEYLEAQYYTYATTGAGIPAAGVGIDGKGQQGFVTIKDNPKVSFTTPVVEDYAFEIAGDERSHVRFFRAALGADRVAQPAINLRESFNTLGQIVSGMPFDPFENEINFLVGAFIFEDVGVTAFKGAARLITNKDFLEAAAGVLAVEAYHASNIRVNLFNAGSEVRKLAKAISNLRRSLSGADDDQGVGRRVNFEGRANIVPTDSNSLVYSRTTRQVLNIVYGEQGADKGLFFPNGINTGA